VALQLHGESPERSGGESPIQLWATLLGAGCKKRRNKNERMRDCVRQERGPGVIFVNTSILRTGELKRILSS
jgi:hypothetical protein